MSRLEIRYLGGFEIWAGEERVTGFESRKVRGLAAYVFRQRGRSLERERLAALFWPERGGDSAKRNLRQALYNLKTSLETSLGSADAVPLEVDTSTVRALPGPELWLDVERFETALRAQESSGDPRFLTEAVQLYRGDFLAGLTIGDSIEFEEWLVEEQEQLRQAALSALKALVQSHLEARSWAIAVRYCHQLLSIDPLSEEGHRTLMRLHALAGRRSRALTQYEELVRLLDDELGIEPLDETKALYESIRVEEVPLPKATVDVEPVGPLVPLVGRERELERLGEIWSEVRRLGARLTWIVGPDGSGKSRLAKSALRDLGAAPGPTVLLGRTPEGPKLALRALREALTNTCKYEPEAVENVLALGSREVLRHLARLVPRLVEIEPALAPEDDEDVPDLTADDLLQAVAVFLESLARRGDSGLQGVVLFLDDLQRADRATVDLLARLPERLGRLPVWLLAATEGPEPPIDLPDADVLTLAPLDAAQMVELSEGLLEGGDAQRLGRFLHTQSAGSPLAATHWINLLWDHGGLAPRPGGRWSLEESLDEIGTFEPTGADEIARARAQVLPPSTRRLAVLAAVFGPCFDSDDLHRIEGEAPEVVSANLEVLLKRWLLRVNLGYWADSRKDRDVALWTSTHHSQVFEFAHDSLATALRELPLPERRAIIHRRIADDFTQRSDGDPLVVAHHLLSAGALERAIDYLEQGARRARSLGAYDVARQAYEQALDAFDTVDREAAARGNPRLDPERRAALERQLSASSTTVAQARPTPARE